MKRKINLLLIVAVVVALTLMLSGCDKSGHDLEGMNIVTFELTGGTLEYTTSSVDTKINFAYHPGTYILDPSTLPNYSLTRQEYEFTGWYTTPECNPADKWDFTTPFNTETLTLYAGWEKAIKFTYTVYYVDAEGQDVSLGQYKVVAGDSFEDWRGFADLRNGYTAMGYYSDKEFTAAWDDDFVHPGGEVDVDIPVYVSYIEGDWALADDFETLRDAIKSGENVYLLSDVDCGGEVLIDPLLTPNYAGTFEGNGHTVSNFTVEKSGSLRPAIAIFKELDDGAVIRNVSFTNVSMVLGEVGSSVSTVKAAALAVSARGTVTVSNVSVSAALTTSYTGDLSKLQSVAFEGDTVTENNFSANITVENNT